MEYKRYERNLRKRKKRVQRIKYCLVAMLIAMLVLMVYLGVSVVALICKTIEYTEKNQIELEQADDIHLHNELEDNSEKSKQQVVMEKLEDFALQHNFSVEEYPNEVIELLEKNSETEEFVLYYPLRKDSYSTETLDEALGQNHVPLFLQWDNRWGYFTYGNKPMGMTGCGPTCLSMVALQLLQNPQLTPQYVAAFAEQNGFYVEGTGTAWSLMTVGAAELGLDAREVSLDEDLVIRYLSEGKPIICAMGRGDFTENGHFIVFIGTEDGKIQVNDPNSRIRSEKLWSFDELKYQIKNMWVYSVK